MVKEDTYIAIQAFMVNDLHLSGNELIVYALIHGFSQDGQSWFSGSSSYIAEWCQCTKGTALSILKRLVDKGLIDKREKFANNVKLCDYRCVPVVQKSYRGSSKIVPPPGSKTVTHNIDIDTIGDNKKEEKETLNSIIESYSDNEELRQALKDFLKHRKTLKKPMTNRALKMLLSQLDNNTTSDSQKIDALDKSIYHGWQTVYFNSKPKENTTDNMTESERKTLEILMEYGA